MNKIYDALWYNTFRQALHKNYTAISEQVSDDAWGKIREPVEDIITNQCRDETWYGVKYSR